MDPFEAMELEDRQEAPQAAAPPRRSFVLWLVAIGLGILILPISQVGQTVRADNVRLGSVLDNAQTAVGQTPTVGPEMADLRSTMSALQAQANVLSPLTKNLTSQQVDWTGAVTAISDYDPSRIAVTGLEQHDNRIVITGRADNDISVMAYARALEDSGQFSRVVVQSISAVTTPFTTPTPGGYVDTTAETIYLGEPQTRVFEAPQQEHVFVFLAKAGRFYQVATTGLAPGVDTSMTVTLDDGTSYANDDAKPAVLSSEVDFQAPAENMNATIRITNMGRSGPDSSYQLVVKEVVPTPTPKSSGSGGGKTSNSVAKPTKAPTATKAPTNTPEPTNTPKPTSKPKPTKVVKPTNTPQPTATATQDLRDSSEPDNATPANIGVGGTQERNFYPDADVDASKFHAKKNRYYLVSTANLAPGVDTLLNVAQGAGAWQNDDYAPAGTGDYASIVCFQTPATGDVVINVSNTTGQYGPDLTYDLTVAEVAGLTANPAALSFGPIAEDDPAALPDQTLDLTSTVNTDWDAVSDSPWLSVDAASGTTSSTITVSVDRTGMAAGTYQAALTIRWSSGCAKQVAVSLQIDPPLSSSSELLPQRFARIAPVWRKSVRPVVAGTPAPVKAVEFAILVELQTEKP